MFKYYSNNIPNINENVLIKFNEKSNFFFKGNLVEYDYECFMNFSDASKKKKVVNWNKIVILNKNIVGKVINIDEKNIVQISIIYLNDNLDTIPNNISDKTNIQDKLMIYFNNNKKLYHFMKSFCIAYEYNFINLWSTLIHYIDTLKKINNENISIWEYFNNNISLLNDWFITCELDLNIYSNLTKYYNDKIIHPYKISSKFGIIINDDITIVKNLLHENTKDLLYKFELIYISAPYYIFETFNIDSNTTDHDNFIKNLLESSKKITDIFIKVEYIAKIID